MPLLHAFSIFERTDDRDAFECLCGVHGTREDIERHIIEETIQPLPPEPPISRTITPRRRFDTPAHRFVNDGVSPVAIDEASFTYACVCGVRGTYMIVEQHIMEAASRRKPLPVDDDPSIPIETDLFGGDTKAHYMPIEPRQPAPVPACPFCEIGTPIADLPEITAWSCGHWARKQLRSIAEAFQDMLRTAYQAGATARDGETFESWYHKEILHNE